MDFSTWKFKNILIQVVKWTSDFKIESGNLKSTEILELICCLYILQWTAAGKLGDHDPPVAPPTVCKKKDKDEEEDVH